jgi:hypothetical protein
MTLTYYFESLNDMYHDIDHIELPNEPSSPHSFDLSDYFFDPDPPEERIFDYPPPSPAKQR